MKTELKVNKLNKVLAVNEEAPKDLLTSQNYISGIDKAIELVKDLVYPPTEEGGKESKKTTASIRKYATAIDAQVNSEYKDKISLFADKKTLLNSKTKELKSIARGIDEQQAERIQIKIDEIREQLKIELAYSWNEAGVRNEYQSDLSVIDKAAILTSQTSKGVLTKKAKDYIKSVCDNNLKKQNMVDSRHIVLENLCMKAGVDSNALTIEYIGPDFFNTNESVFTSRVDELLAIEVQKKEATKKRVEEEKQKAVNEALAKQQAEADKVAQEKAQQQTIKSMDELPSEIPPATIQQMDADRAQAEVQKRATVTPIKTDKKPLNGKHPVQITFTLEKMIRDDVSDEAVAQYFMDNVLSDDLKSLVIAHSAQTVKKAG